MIGQYHYVTNSKGSFGTGSFADSIIGAVLKEALSKEGKLYDEVVFHWVGDSEIERVPCFPPMGWKSEELKMTK